jgi:hypothetical protein
MSFMSASCAEHHNAWVKAQAAKLRKALGIQALIANQLPLGSPLHMELNGTEADALRLLLVEMDKGPFSE